MCSRKVCLIITNVAVSIGTSEAQGNVSSILDHEIFVAYAFEYLARPLNLDLYLLFEVKRSEV